MRHSSAISGVRLNLVVSVPLYTLVISSAGTYKLGGVVPWQVQGPLCGAEVGASRRGTEHVEARACRKGSRPGGERVRATPMFSTMKSLVYWAIVMTQHWPVASSGPP